MIRIVGLIALALIAFAAAVVGPMAATGNLNAEAVNRLLGRESAIEDAPTEDPDTVGPVVRRLKEEEARLKAKEEELNERETRLDQREQELGTTLAKVQEIQAQITTSLDQMDADRATRVKEVAESVESMTEEAAAETLAELNPEDVAEILRIVKVRKRGAILDAMENTRRSLIFEIMQERKY